MGGHCIDRPGAFMKPTTLTPIETSNPAYRVEFFGPVALFFRMKDENEAVALANDSDFCLGGSVFTHDIVKGEVYCQPNKHGHGIHQSADLDIPRTTVRRHQELGLWP